MRYTNMTHFRNGSVLLVGKKRNEHTKCDDKSCIDCKQAICGSKVFCALLKRFVEQPQRDDGIGFFVCPEFETEPLQYKIYRRS